MNEASELEARVFARIERRKKDLRIADYYCSVVDRRGVRVDWGWEKESEAIEKLGRECYEISHLCQVRILMSFISMGICTSFVSILEFETCV